MQSDSNVLLEVHGAILTATILCEIDHHTARMLRVQIDRKMEETAPEVVCLDFSAVHFMDSSGIGLILGRAALGQKRGIRIRVVGVRPSLRKIFALSGVEKIGNVTVIPMREDEHETLYK